MTELKLDIESSLLRFGNSAAETFNAGLTSLQNQASSVGDGIATINDVANLLMIGATAYINKSKFKENPTAAFSTISNILRDRTIFTVLSNKNPTEWSNTVYNILLTQFAPKPQIGAVYNEIITLILDLVVRIHTILVDILGDKIAVFKGTNFNVDSENQIDGDTRASIVKMLDVMVNMLHSISNIQDKLNYISAINDDTDSVEVSPSTNTDDTPLKILTKLVEFARDTDQSIAYNLVAIIILITELHSKNTEFLKVDPNLSLQSAEIDTSGNASSIFNQIGSFMPNMPNMNILGGIPRKLRRTRRRKNGKRSIRKTRQCRRFSHTLTKYKTLFNRNIGRKFR